MQPLNYCGTCSNTFRRQYWRRSLHYSADTIGVAYFMRIACASHMLAVIKQALAVTLRTEQSDSLHTNLYMCKSTTEQLLHFYHFDFMTELNPCNGFLYNSKWGPDTAPEMWQRHWFAEASTRVHKWSWHAAGWYVDPRHQSRVTDPSSTSCRITLYWMAAWSPLLNSYALPLYVQNI